MESYSKMRNELAEILTELATDVDLVLQALDGVARKYETTDRKFDDLTALDVFDEYINSCKYEKMSAGTIENYQLVIGRMLRKMQLSIDAITTNDLRNYLCAYQAERGVSDSTVNKYREYMRSFFGWCYNEGYTVKNPAANLKEIRCEKKQKRISVTNRFGVYSSSM